MNSCAKSKLEHRHIVHFYGIYESPAKEKYLVLEYMNKGSLQTLLQENEGKIPIRDLTSL